jgi:hypothetical protein
METGSGKNLFRIPDPGVEKHRIPDPDHNTQFGEASEATLTFTHFKLLRYDTGNSVICS